MMVSRKFSKRLEKLFDFLGPSEKSGEVFEWWVFPSIDKPRVMIPLDPLFWDRGLAFISSPRKRFCLKLLLGVRRLLRRKSDFKFQGAFPQSLTEGLGRDSGKLAHLAVYVSTPSRFSKYTLVLLNQSAEPLGFAKVSEGRDADKAIADEVEALAFLAKEFPESASFPRVIHQAEGVAIQSPAPSSGHGNLAENAGRIADQLFRSRVKEVSWADSESRRFLLEAGTEVQVAGRADLRELLEEMECQISKKFGNDLIREGLTHGDFVSWNMADCSEGFIFDWEWMARRTQYHDLFHYLWIRDLQKDSTSQMSLLAARWESTEGKALLGPHLIDHPGPLCRDALLYLASSFAFYARHSIANQSDPLALPFMVIILSSFRSFAAQDGRAPFGAGTFISQK